MIAIVDTWLLQDKRLNEVVCLRRGKQINRK